MLTIRRFLTFTCCFVLLNLLIQIEIQNEARKLYEERKPGGGKTQGPDRNLTHELNTRWHMNPDAEILLSHQNLRIQSSHTRVKSGNSSLFTNHKGDQENVQSKPSWTHITDELYVYSGFWDDRENLTSGPVARVLGILRYNKKSMQVSEYQWTGDVRRDALNYSCYLWYEGGQARRGNLSAFVFEEGLKVFVGTYLLCSPQELSNASNHRVLDVPYAVSIVPHGSSSYHHLVYLNSTRETKKADVNSSGVCVRPLFGPYSDLGSIAQFLSYYTTALNVSHFYFYDYAISKEVKEFLTLLTNVGEIHIHLLSWNVPFSDWETLWDLGSLSSINDCMYRTSGRHKYVAIVDIDEFIVPRIPARTLGEFYSAVIKQKQGLEGDALLVRNAFFCQEFQDENKTTSDFIIFRITLRETRPWPSKSRSKMVVVPEAVIAVGHHMVHHFLRPTSKNQSLSKLLAILHHYRKCDGLRMGMHGTGTKVLDLKPLRDNAILKYRGAVLGSRTLRLYRHFINPSENEMV